MHSHVEGDFPFPHHLNGFSIHILDFLDETDYFVTFTLNKFQLRLKTKPDPACPIIKISNTYLLTDSIPNESTNNFNKIKNSSSNFHYYTINFESKLSLLKRVHLSSNFQLPDPYCIEHFRNTVPRFLTMQTFDVS